MKKYDVDLTIYFHGRQWFNDQIEAESAEDAKDQAWDKALYELRSAVSDYDIDDSDVTVTEVSES